MSILANAVYDKPEMMCTLNGFLYGLRVIFEFTCHSSIDEASYQYVTCHLVVSQIGLDTKISKLCGNQDAIGP